MLEHLSQEKSPILAAALLSRMAIAGVAEALLAVGPSPRPLSDLWASLPPWAIPSSLGWLIWSLLVHLYLLFSFPHVNVK